MKWVLPYKYCKINHNNESSIGLLVSIILFFLITPNNTFTKALSFSLKSTSTSITTRRVIGYQYPPKFTSTTIATTATTSNQGLCLSTRSYSNIVSNFNEENSITRNNETVLIDSIIRTTALSATNTTFINMSIKAIGSSTTIFVSGLFFIVLAYKRNTQMISFFIGAIMNGILSKILKKLIQQTRPVELYQTSSSSTNSTSVSANEISNKPTDHGMPSSHAMSLGFISTFIVCNIMSLQIPLLLYTIISLYYRVQVKLHTYQQVVVGTILGSTNGFLWYRLCTGNNPFHVHIMNLVKQYLFNNKEQLPIPYLIVPLLVGAATIGSFERRISALLRKNKKAV